MSQGAGLGTEVFCAPCVKTCYLSPQSSHRKGQEKFLCTDQKVGGVMIRDRMKSCHFLGQKAPRLTKSTELRGDEQVSPPKSQEVGIRPLRGILLKSSKELY